MGAYAYPVRRRRRTLLGLGDAGLPAGSQLSYTATWQRTPGAIASSGSLWNDPNTIQAKIQGILSQQFGIVIDSQSHTTSDILPNFAGQSGFTLRVHTVSDRNAASDVQSVIDGVIYNTIGIAPSSQIILIAPGLSPDQTYPVPPPPPQPPVDLGQWLSDNWIWLALGLGAAVAAEELL